MGVSSSSQSGPTATSSVNTTKHDIHSKVAMNGLVEKHIIQTTPSEQMDLILCFRGMRNINKTLLQNNLYRHKGIYIGI